MSHEVETMMFAGETPWHGLGRQVERTITTEEAIVAAGLDWEVGLRGLVTEGETCYGGGEAVAHKASFRKSDGRILGVVGPAWKPLQNREAFAFFDPFLATGEACLETAGSLREGRRVWVLAALNLAPSVIVAKADDVVKKYVLLSNSHDGTTAIKVGFTPIRVVCANTLAMAHADGASTLLRVRHTKNSADALVAVRDVMNTANHSFEATAEQYRLLATKDIVEADLKRYVNAVFAPKRVALAKSKRSVGMVLVSQIIDGILEDEDDLRSNVFPKIQQLFETGRGNNLRGVRGTMWAAYNAVTEYLAYERGANAAVRLNESWFGSGHALNGRAFTAALDIVKKGELVTA